MKRPLAIDRKKQPALEKIQVQAAFLLPVLFQTSFIACRHSASDANSCSVSVRNMGSR